MIREINVQTGEETQRDYTPKELADRLAYKPTITEEKQQQIDEIGLSPDLIAIIDKIGSAGLPADLVKRYNDTKTLRSELNDGS